MQTESITGHNHPDFRECVMRDIDKKEQLIKCKQAEGQLKNEPELSSIPVVVSTASAEAP